MNVLAIDTSNQVMGVALLSEDKVIGEIVTNGPKNHSVRLMPAIDQIMKEASLVPEDLDKIVVAKGPGSYTGVRIGLATAKTFAWTLNIPIVGVSSLEVLAYQGRFFNGYICPFFDARRGMVFTGVYKWQNNQLEQVFEEKNIAMDVVMDRLKEEQQSVLFLSPDIAIYKDALHEKLGELAVIPEGPYHIAKPSFLGLAGLNREADETHTLTPNYLRLAEAEANWLKEQKESKNA